MQNPDFQEFIQQPAVENVIWSVIVVLAAILLTRFLRRVAARYVEEPERHYKIGKLIGRLLGLLALMAIVFVWAGDVPGVFTLLTVIGAGLAIALRELVLSLAGWANIAIRTPFRQGDRIEVNGIQGDVIDVRLLHSTLMETGGWTGADQSTGRIVHIPNGWIYQFGVYNYTRGFNFIWNEIPFILTFRSDWNAAREIMLRLATEKSGPLERQVKHEISQMSREYLIYFSVLTPFVYVSMAENGVRLSLRYLTEVRKRRGSEHALTVAILEAFKENGHIEVAYRTRHVAAYDSPQFGPLPGATGVPDDGASSERS